MERATQATSLIAKLKAVRYPRDNYPGTVGLDPDMQLAREYFVK